MERRLTIEQLVDQYGLCAETWRRACRSGKVKGAAKIGGWKVRPEDAEEFIRAHIPEANRGDALPAAVACSTTCVHGCSRELQRVARSSSE